MQKGKQANTAKDDGSVGFECCCKRAQGAAPQIKAEEWRKTHACEVQKRKKLMKGTPGMGSLIQGGVAGALNTVVQLTDAAIPDVIQDNLQEVFQTFFDEHLIEVLSFGVPEIKAFLLCLSKAAQDYMDDSQLGMDPNAGIELITENAGRGLEGVSEGLFQQLVAPITDKMPLPEPEDDTMVKLAERMDCTDEVAAAMLQLAEGQEASTASSGLLPLAVASRLSLLEVEQEGVLGAGVGALPSQSGSGHPLHGLVARSLRALPDAVNLDYGDLQQQLGRRHWPSIERDDLGSANAVDNGDLERQLDAEALLRQARQRKSLHLTAAASFSLLTTCMRLFLAVR